MNKRTREALKYVGIFLALLAVFYGGNRVLRGSLGTPTPMMVVISQSMVPTLGVGDFIVIQAIPDFDQVKVGEPPVGDILVFRRPGNSEEFIVHRAISAQKRGDTWFFQTKGDNNLYPDGFQVPQSTVVGKVVNRIPIIGYFSLFIKTTKGFTMILALMAFSFFYDNILPPKQETGNTSTLLATVALLPFAVAPIALVSLWLNPVNHVSWESASIAAWYLGSALLPLVVDDDETGLMIWLYHLVLLMIPIACDIVWWRTGITPSNWWYVSGSSLPISWLFMREAPAFNKVFTNLLTYLLPGIILFIGILSAKRMQIKPVNTIVSKLRTK